MSIDTTQAIMANPKFQQLTRARARLGWSLAIIMWIFYFGFILLVAFNKTDGLILSQKVGGGTASLAIAFGFALLVLTFIITAFYVVVANAKFDTLTRELRREIGQ